MTAQPPGKDDYILDRGYAATSRLNLQHFLWCEIFGYLIHPTIEFKDKDNIAIADIGTGTGQWLFDLSQQVPKTCELHGLDIDISQAPPQEWCPDNVFLRRWDVTQEVPSDLAGKFDLVQIRLFVFVVKNNDPSALLKKLMQLLKPGGYIQWGEPDFETRRIMKVDAGSSTQMLETLFQETTSKDARLRPTWVGSLLDVFASQGLSNVVEDRKAGPPHNWFAFNECNFMVYDELFQRNDIPEDAKVELKKLVPLAVQECRAGAATIVDRVHVVGKKV